MRKFLSLWTLVLCFAASLATTLAQIETKWISQAVVPGEKTIFLVIMTNGNMVEPLPLPNIAGASVRYAGSNYLSWPGAPNKTAYLIAFDVTADKPGIVTIPSITLRADTGATFQTQPQKLTVYPFDAIQWAPMPQTNGQLQYGTLWHLSDKAPYVNQPDLCELKFYTPPIVTDYQIPVIKTNGVASWRFEPTVPESSIRPRGTALIRGREWKVMTFNSALIPLRGGEVSASGSITAFALQENADPVLAQFVRNLIPIPLPIPPISINAQSLPSNAPASFSNAVGKLTISTSTEALDLSANEPISVKITVQGTGNIDSLNCPIVKDSSLWKLYPPNKLSKEESRSLSGSVIFQQLLRPTAETDCIPPFELTYFDPSLQTYTTVTSAPIPLPWKASSSGMVSATSVAVATPPPAGTIPVEKMTDIYGLIPIEIENTLSERTSTLWFLLAYLPAIAIMGYAVNKLLKKRRAMSTESRARLVAFKAISIKESPNAFLRSLGSFIEANIPEKERNSQIKEILETRDAQAFLPESEGKELSASRKSAMLKQVKHILAKLPLIAFAMLILAPNSLTGAEESVILASSPHNTYSRGEYSLAAKEFEQKLARPHLSSQAKAASYFGLANCLYRLNNPGEAALNYRRALNVTPNFKEASKNLAFIERKEGAVMPHLDGKTEWLTFVSYNHLMPIILVSGAILLTSLACLIVFGKYKIFLSLISVFALLTITAGIANKLMYPELPNIVNQDQLLIAILPTPARHAADPDSPALLTLPSSTPMIELAKRGSWYYIRTFNGTPAWVHKNTVAPVSQ